MGKAYNEFKQGEPAIERLFDLTRFQCKVNCFGLTRLGVIGVGFPSNVDIQLVII